MYLLILLVFSAFAGLLMVISSWLGGLPLNPSGRCGLLRCMLFPLPAFRLILLANVGTVEVTVTVSLRVCCSSSKASVHWPAAAGHGLADTVCRAVTCWVQSPVCCVVGVPLFYSNIFVNTNLDLVTNYTCILCSSRAFRQCIALM